MFMAGLEQKLNTGVRKVHSQKKNVWGMEKMKEVPSFLELVCKQKKIIIIRKNKKEKRKKEKKGS